MERSHTNLVLTHIKAKIKAVMAVPGGVMLGRRVKTVGEDRVMTNQSLLLLIKEKERFLGLIRIKM